MTLIFSSWWYLNGFSFFSSHCRDLSATNISILLNNAFANLHILEELWVDLEIKSHSSLGITIIWISIRRSLAENQLLKIERNSFYGLKKLKRLVLSNCRLMRIPGESFKHLNSLNTLWVFKSLVKFTTTLVFSPCHLLRFTTRQWIDPTSQPFTHPALVRCRSYSAEFQRHSRQSIDDYSANFKRTMNGSNFNCKFVIRTTIRRRLDGNEFEHLDEDSFQFVPNLRKLGLNKNHINTFPRQILATFASSLQILWVVVKVFLILYLSGLCFNCFLCFRY